MDVASELKAAFTHYAEDPIGFAERVLGVRFHWDASVEMLEAIRDHRQVAVAACHSSSKTFSAAVACLWFFYTQIPAKVITTAPSQRQVEELLWSEIRKLHGNARIPLPGTPLGTFMRMPSPKSRPNRNDDWFMTGFATKADQAQEHATRFHGYHQRNILVVFDEAAGILAPIWGGAEGVMTGANPHWLAIGNPTDSSGEFFRSYRSKDWHSIRIDAYDSPNVKAREVIVPYLVDHLWVDIQRRKYGEQSPIFKAKVRGLFPDRADDTLISMGEVDEAYRREPPALERPLLSLGCDVARYGSARTCMYVIRGAEVLDRKWWIGQDLMRTAGEVLILAAKWGLGPADANRIAIDDTGLGGGVTDRLREQGWDVNAVNFGTPPAYDPGTFTNRRAELWWTMRDWIRDEAALSRLAEADPDAPEDLRADLTAPKYQVKSSGKIALEEKDAILKRLGHSPDDGDALALALAWRRPTTGGVRAEWPVHLFEGQEIAAWADRLEYSVMVVACQVLEGGTGVIVALGRTRDGKLHCEADVVRGTAEDTIEAVADHAHLRLPDAVAFLEDQLAGLFRDRIEKAMQARGFRVPVGAVKLTADEDLRIRRLGPHVLDRELHYLDRSPGTATLLRAMKDFPGGIEKALPSTLEMALRVAVRTYNSSRTRGIERLPI